MYIVRGGRLLCSNHSAAHATWFSVRRVRSIAASPSESDSPKRNRISKNERRALIVSFVNRYRSMNAGKFPSASAAQKEVGGSYYVVREILQELEYKSKICSSNNSYENLSVKVVNKEDKPFSAVEVVSTGLGAQDDTCAKAMDASKMLDTYDKQLEIDRGSSRDYVLEENIVLKDAKGLERREDDKVEDVDIDSSDKFHIIPEKQEFVKATEQDLESEELCKTKSRGVQSDFGVVKGGLLKEETEIGNEEGDEKEQTPSKESLKSGSPEPKAEHRQQLLEEEKYTRNLSSEQTNDADSSKKPTLWGNLKSFADGIINIWRKM